MNTFLILSAATAATAIFMTINGLLLIGFRRGRLRGYNIYIVFTIALLGLTRFIDHQNEVPHSGLSNAAWVNLAIGSLIGLWGMLGIARTDPPVFGGKK